MTLDDAIFRKMEKLHKMLDFSKRLSVICCDLTISEKMGSALFLAKYQSYWYLIQKLPSKNKIKAS